MKGGGLYFYYFCSTLYLLCKPSLCCVVLWELFECCGEYMCMQSVFILVVFINVVGYVLLYLSCVMLNCVVRVV